MDPEQMKNEEKPILQPKKKRKFPKVCKVIYALTAISVLLYLTFGMSAKFSDWFNFHISHYARRFLSLLTSWLPFSFAEVLLLFLPIFTVLLIVVAIRKYSRTKRDTLIFLGRLFAGICCILILFVWCFAPGYYGTTLDQKLSMERKEVSAKELFATASILAKEIEPLSENLLFPSENSSSVMPYSLDEMNEKLMDAYQKVQKTYDFPKTFSSRVKPVMLSVPMSYTHITGVYTFFTGEANINVNFPDYTIPFTAAHELAHQRGVAREDEANFMAFLVCSASEDEYIRYSGYLNLYEYVVSALYSADRDLWISASGLLSKNAYREEVAYRDFFDRYRENPAADVSNATNNAYLQMQGAKEGTKSYDLVVDLAVAYYRPQIEN